MYIILLSVVRRDCLLVLQFLHAGAIDWHQTVVLIGYCLNVRSLPTTRLGVLTSTPRLLIDDLPPSARQDFVAIPRFLSTSAPLCAGTKPVTMLTSSKTFPALKRVPTLHFTYFALRCCSSHCFRSLRADVLRVPNIAFDLRWWRGSVSRAASFSVASREVRLQ